MLYTEIIRRLDDDLLLELYENLTEMLKTQRQIWLNNATHRTDHLSDLIIETRDELEFVQSQLQFRKLKEI